jgi:hypothetical protein
MSRAVLILCFRPFRCPPLAFWFNHYDGGEVKEQAGRESESRRNFSEKKIFTAAHWVVIAFVMIGCEWKERKVKQKKEKMSQ